MAWCPGIRRVHRPLITLLFLSSINFLDSYSRYLISVASIPYIEYSSYEYSLLSGALFAIVYATGGVLIASHRLINRRVVLALTTSSLAFSIAFLLTAVTTAFWQLAIIRAAMGLANSLFTPLATRILGSLFDESSRGLTFGLFNFSVYLSFAVCLSLGTYMYDEYGWEAGYLIFGFIGIVLSASLPCVLLCGPKTGGHGENAGGSRFGSRSRLSSSGITAIASSASTGGEEDEEGGAVGGAVVPRRPSSRLAVTNGGEADHGEYRQLDAEVLGSPGPPAHATGGSNSADEAALVRATMAGSSSSSDAMRSRSHTSLSPHLEEGGLGGRGGTYTPLETQEHRDNNHASVDLNSESSMRWSGERLKTPFFDSGEAPSMEALLLPSDSSLPPLSQLEAMESSKKRTAKASPKLPSPAPRRPAAASALSVSSGGGGDLEDVRLTNTPQKPLHHDRHRDADGLTVSSGRSGAPVYVEEDFFDQQGREGEGDEEGEDDLDDYEYDSDDGSVDTWTLLWPNYPPSGPAPPSGAGIPGPGVHDERYRSVGSTATGTSRLVVHAGLRGHGRPRPSLWKAIKGVLKFWRRNPAVILLCLATGVRLGGGYVWSAYTSVFFSELYVDEGTSCTYSNPSVNATASLQSIMPGSSSSSFGGASFGGARTAAAGDGVCDQDYPYCIEGICKDLSDTPWHNQGMSHLKLESYISWVPLVGSGVGSVLGCMLSDRWVASLRSRRRQASSGSALASLTRPLRAVAEWSNALWWQPRTETVVTAAGVVAATAAGSSSSSAHASRVSISSSSSAPDHIGFSGLETRALLVAVSCAAAAPIVVAALNAGYPDCFWFMVLSGLFGEVYFGITLTLLSEITPKRMTVLCVALFSLCSIVVATMVQLLIPYLKRVFDSQLGPHTFLVFAAPSESGAGIDDEVPYLVQETGAAGLQRAMKVVLFSAYLGGALLYLASYLRLKKDLRRSKGSEF